nr:uncharacterized protein LOC110125775 [Odocoileus virginianus texanus]
MIRSDIARLIARLWKERTNVLLPSLAWSIRPFLTHTSFTVQGFPSEPDMEEREDPAAGAESSLLRASLGIQELRSHWPRRGTRVRSLVQEDPTCCGPQASEVQPLSLRSGARTPQREQPLTAAGESPGTARKERKQAKRSLQVLLELLRGSFLRSEKGDPLTPQTEGLPRDEGAAETNPLQAPYGERSPGRWTDRPRSAKEPVWMGPLLLEPISREAGRACPSGRRGRGRGEGPSGHRGRRAGRAGGDAPGWGQPV